MRIIPSIFSDHNEVRLDVNYREKKQNQKQTNKQKTTTIKNTNIWRSNNTLLHNQKITEEIKKNQNMHRNE